jgi:hypothetical protein
VFQNKDTNSNQKCYSQKNSQIPRHIQEDINQLNLNVTNKENNNSMNICPSNSQSKSGSDNSTLTQDRQKKTIFKNPGNPSVTQFAQNPSENLNAKSNPLSKNVAKPEPPASNPQG